MKQQSGFTLIEALVTGIISAGFTGVILSLFYMNNAQIIAGTRLLRLSQKYSLISDQIKQTARNAAFVYDGPVLPTGPIGTLPSPKHKIYFFNENRELIGGYDTKFDYNHTSDIDVYRLDELKAGNWVPFNAGDNRPVHLIHRKGGGNHAFVFLPEFIGIQFFLEPVQIESNERFPIKTDSETVLLRNAIH
jgi:type II secretory pathway pseudopilin PulG